MFTKFKAKLNEEVIWGQKVIYFLSWIFIILIVILIIFRYFNTNNDLRQYLEYSTLFFVLLVFLVINWLVNEKGIKEEKFVLGVILGFLGLNLLWLAEATMSAAQTGFEEKIFLSLRLNYLVLILGLILLSLNRGPLGFWLKSWFLKFRDPRAFIVLALVFLVLCPFLLVFRQEPVAEKAANMAYFMLVIGVFGRFVEYMRNSRKESKKENKLSK